MMDKKIFKKAIALPLAEAGFIKKGQSWYLDGKDSIVVINLQKCDWNESYFINIGIWLKALGEAVFPQDNHCHLYYRVEKLFPEQRDLILMSCDLEKTNTEMLADLSKFIKNPMVPFLEECTYVNKLRDFMSKGLLSKGMVRIEAEWYLIGE